MMRRYGRFTTDGPTNLDEATVDYIKGLLDACVETAKMSKHDMAYLALDDKGRVRAYGACNIQGIPLVQVCVEGKKVEFFPMPALLPLFPEVKGRFDEAFQTYS